MTQGVIYRLVCKDENIKDTYIGSCDDMHKRHICHKNKCNNSKTKQYNTPVYKFIREHGGIDNWDMELIEECECRDTRHLETVEQFYIDVEGGIEFLLNEQDAIQDNEKNKIIKHESSINCARRHIDNKDFYCECCDHAFRNNSQLQRHYNTKRHIKQRDIDNKDFYCEPCKHAFRNNCDLQRHYNTKKHINKMASSFS